MGSKSGKGQKATRLSRKRWCQAYRASNRRMHNKIRRVRKHLKSHANDAQARKWLEAQPEAK